MSLADFSQHIFHRHLAILEIELNGRGSLNAHLVFFRTLRKPFKASFYNKRGEFIAVYFCKNGVHIGKTTVGNPAFLPV